jgi:hypothetical protein
MEWIRKAFEPSMETVLFVPRKIQSIQSGSLATVRHACQILPIESKVNAMHLEAE